MSYNIAYELNIGVWRSTLTCLFLFIKGNSVATDECGFSLMRYKYSSISRLSMLERGGNSGTFYHVRDIKDRHDSFMGGFD